MSLSIFLNKIETKLNSFAAIVDTYLTAWEDRKDRMEILETQLKIETARANDFFKYCQVLEKRLGESSKLYGELVGRYNLIRGDYDNIIQELHEKEKTIVELENKLLSILTEKEKEK